MNYDVFLSKKAEKQYKKLDRHIQNRLKEKLLEMKENPCIGFILTGKHKGLRYVKTLHKRVEYRIVYDISENSSEVMVVFLGSRENFYKELIRYLG